MQQMMGMFQMFMMNQTIGMQQQQQQLQQQQQQQQQTPSTSTSTILTQTQTSYDTLQHHHSQSTPPTPSNLHKQHSDGTKNINSAALQMSNTSTTPNLSSSTPSQLKQSQSAINISPGSTVHTENITKSRSYGDDDKENYYIDLF